MKPGVQWVHPAQFQQSERNVGALIIRIGCWARSDIRLKRIRREMTCASMECVATYEQQLREFVLYVFNVSQHGVIFH